MSKKINIPGDWSKLSDKAAAEFIKYLRKNYKKYDVSVCSNHIYIGNIDIFSYAKPKQDVPYKSIYSASDIEVCIEINNRAFFSDNGAVFQDLQQLKQDCVRHYRCRQNWNKYGEKALLAIISAALISAVAVGYVKYNQLEKEKSASDATVQKATAERTANTAKFIEHQSQRRK